MAAAKKDKKDKPEHNGTEPTKAQLDDFSQELIRQLNKEHGSNIAFNLASDDAPTDVRRWISTGSRELDYIISNRRDGGFPEGRIVEIQGPPSCHAKGDQVMMFDGSIKKIEDVKVGDKVMGPDSQARTVLRLVRGKDRLYRLNPGRHADQHHVSNKHLLPLWKTRNSHQGPDFVEMSVEDYLKQSNWFKTSYSLKRSAVNFKQTGRKSSKVIPPYILGLLLGDGSMAENRIELTTADIEIEREFTDFAHETGFGVSRHEKKDNKATGLYLTSGWNPGKALNLATDKNKIRAELRRLNLLGTVSGNKFVPQEYKTGSTAARLELLAGLIDTDGHYSASKNNYEFVSKSKQLTQDVQFLARTTGLCSSPLAKKNVNGTCYYRVSVSGKIPCRVARKQGTETVLPNTHRFTLKSIGQKRIYGITVSHDSLYLMSDTTIQRNCGKSHIGFEIAKATQKVGGIVVYIDTENATSPANLAQLHIDVARRFVFVQTACTEEILSVIESTIIKARAMTKDVPVTVIWDSVSQSSPKAELEGDYDQNTIGLQARVLSKGMRKIANVIGGQKVLLVLMSQQRTKIGVMYGDPTTTSGGMAVPYAASTRIKIGAGAHVKDKNDNVVGIEVTAKTIKNKVGRPFREATFQIHFGVGVVDHENLFDSLRAHCDANGPANVDGVLVSVEGTGAWKEWKGMSTDGEVVFEKKFYKADFNKILNDPQYKKYVDGLCDAAFIMHALQDEHPTYKGVDSESIEEVQAASIGSSTQVPEA